MIESFAITNPNNLVPLIKADGSEQTAFRVGDIVMADVMDIIESGMITLRIIPPSSRAESSGDPKAPGERTHPPFVFRAKSDIAMSKGDKVLLEIMGAGKEIQMRFIGTAKGMMTNQPLGTENLPREIMKMLSELSGSRLKSSDFQLIKNAFNSLPESVKFAHPEFRAFEKLLPGIENLNNRLLRQSVEGSGVLFETKLKLLTMKDTLQGNISAALPNQAEAGAGLIKGGEVVKGSGMEGALKTMDSSGAAGKGITDNVAVLKNVLQQSGISLSANSQPETLTGAVQNMSSNNASQLRSVLSGMGIYVEWNEGERSGDLRQVSIGREDFQKLMSLLSRESAHSERPAMDKAVPNETTMKESQILRGAQGEVLIKGQENVIEKPAQGEKTIESAIISSLGKEAEKGDVTKSSVLNEVLNRAGEDQKGLLLKIKEILQNDNMNEILKESGLRQGDLLETVDKFVKNIEYFQLTSKANDVLYTFLPLSWHELKDGELLFRRNKYSGKKSYTCDINLDLEDMGKVSISTTMYDGEFYVSFQAEQEDTRTMIGAERSALEKRFHDVELPLKSITVGLKHEVKFGNPKPKGLSVKV